MARLNNGAHITQNTEQRGRRRQNIWRREKKKVAEINGVLVP